MYDAGVAGVSRRRVLAAFVNGTLALLGAGLAALLGAFAVVPRVSVQRRWVRAASLADLDPKAPTAAIVAVARQDGWARVRVSETVFLKWDGLTEVRALSSTCTHLGCRVRWDDGAGRFRCPCHGGEYDANGRVTAGPPPRALDGIEARITDEGDVEVRL